MAISNVRFYKLNVLPNFEAKHIGIFVHVAETMHNEPWTPTNHPKEVDPARLWMEPEKSGESVERINLVKWLSTRHITEIASGLWFGGENGWELLSNETTDAAINAAIDAKIQGLDAGPYAQAEITTANNSSTLTIKGIKEADGIIGIPDSENFNFNIAIDGVYTESNKIATQSTVNNKIGTLDANAFQTVTKSTDGVNTTLTFNGIKEVDGIISQGVTENADTFTVGDAKLKIQIGSAAASDVFSANAQVDSTIELDGNVFTKNGNVISVITPTAVSESNKLVTQQDIASLGGAMHYKGPLTGAQSGDGSWPSTSTVAAGDVYIVTTSFTHSGESNPFEVGDMIVFNTDGDNSKYTVVQSNITLGTGIGQVAANSAALAIGNLVVATDNGIKTISITETQLTGDDNNKRELSYRNGTSDTDTTNNITLHHDVTISDAFQVIGKDFTKTINISSTNRSIEIAANGSNTGVVVDLVWNTTIE